MQKRQRAVHKVCYFAFLQMEGTAQCTQEKNTARKRASGRESGRERFRGNSSSELLADIWQYRRWRGMMTWLSPGSPPDHYSVEPLERDLGAFLLRRERRRRGQARPPRAALYSGSDSRRSTRSCARGVAVDSKHAEADRTTLEFSTWPEFARVGARSFLVYKSGLKSMLEVE